MFLVYLTQGIIYYTSLSALPAFFGMYPGLFTIAQQNIFIMIAKSAPLVKIGYGFLMDRSLKQPTTRSFQFSLIGFFFLSVATGILLAVSAAVPLLFLFIFAALFLLVAFFDTCVDAIAVNYSSRDSRIGMVSFMNISYSAGTMVGSMIYLILPRTNIAQWFQFVTVIGIVGIGLLGLLVVVLVTRVRARIQTSNESQSREEPNQLPEVQENEVQLVSGAVPRAEYTNIAVMMMILLFLANFDALVEITTEKWMVSKFGPEGFDRIINFSITTALPVKIGLLIVLFLLRNQLRGKEFKMLYVCVGLSFGYWSLLSFADFGFVLVLILISQIIGVLLLVGMSGLMMRFVPKNRVSAGYQFFTLWYNIPLMVLPAIGNSLYEVVGHEILFLTIAGVIILLIFPLLRRFDTRYGGYAVGLI